MRHSPMPTSVAYSTIADNLTSFRLWLEEKNRSPKTVSTYIEAVKALDAFLEKRGMPRDVNTVTGEHIREFIVDVLKHWKPATAANRYRSLKQFFRFLRVDGLIQADPMKNMEVPKVPYQPPPVLRDEELSKLIGVCDRDKAFEGIRDSALMRVFTDTGCRIGEVLGLRWCPDDKEIQDIDLARGLLQVKGKGGRWRTVSIGAKTARSLDRYIRLRARHSDASGPELWLGRKGGLTDQGMRLTVRRRGAQAGLGRIHPHMLRHSAAHRYLAAGGAETNLMRLMGWTSQDMVARYAASTGQERALEEHKRLGLGDRL